MSTGLIRAFSVALVLLLSGPAWAQNGFERFFGTYVGSGTGQDASGQEIDQRDMDVRVEPYKNEGFSLKWITVIRDPDADRTSPDIKRREIEEQFLPSDDIDGVFIRAPEGGLFQKAELPNPLRGEPMRWASLNGDTLTVYSLGITAEGGSELQIYHRTLTEGGLSAEFLRMHDEEVMLRVNGTLVKTE